ncbi:hypothetical protein [Streptomyces sp. NPDC094049]|uniref:hypothetical protein n=1 Tax=Streptomyces sp. NPDC094049 TaxID=3154987 RepID=UPI003323C34A
MDVAVELRRRTTVMQGDLGHLYEPVQAERSLAAALLASQEANGGRLVPSAVRGAATAWDHGAVTPLLSLLPLVTDLLQDPAARTSADGRSALAELDVLLDAVAAYEGPA